MCSQICNNQLICPQFYNERDKTKTSANINSDYALSQFSIWIALKC